MPFNCYIVPIISLLKLDRLKDDEKKDKIHYFFIKSFIEVSQKNYQLSALLLTMDSGYSWQTVTYV